MYCGCGADSAGLADALGTERISWASGLGVGNFEARQFSSRWHQIIHETCRYRVGVLVILDVFPQCLSDSLSDTAMLLSVDQHGIENGAAVINCDVSQQLDVSGLSVDFYNRHMRTKRVCCVSAIEVKLVSEATFDFLLDSGAR